MSMEEVMADIKKKLGARIQEIRKSKKITQEKLAELINIEPPNLSNIECGKKFMTADTLEKIIEALDVNEKDLFDFEHLLPAKNLEKIIISDIKSLSYKELQYLKKTIDNLKQLRA